LIAQDLHKVMVNADANGIFIWGLETSLATSLPEPAKSQWMRDPNINSSWAIHARIAGAGLGSNGPEIGGTNRTMCSDPQSLQRRL